MTIRTTKAWKAAELHYMDLHAESAMPRLLRSRLSPEEIIGQLEDIIKDCPKFYPALLELGLRRLASGEDDHGKENLEEGYHLMLDLAERAHLNEEIEILIENLESLWRFDVSRHYLQKLVENYPKKPSFHDNLSHAAARLNDIETALFHITKAVEMEPDNSSFLSNLGWIHLMAGNLDEASKALTRAHHINPDDPVVKGNFQIHRYLTRDGGNYFDYLLRSLDIAEIDRLADEEEWETVDVLVESYNSSRLEAMAHAFLQESNKRSRLADLLSTLRHFFGFVHTLEGGGYVLDEEITYFLDRFKPILHKFIFKFGDVDREMIEEIYESLFEYYGFLAQHGLVTTKNFRAFKKTTLGMKKELIDKMERYNKIRHNPRINEEEKEAVREELFEGDHGWPFI